MWAIIWIGLSYIIGSLPSGVIIGKTFCNIDPRTAGSCNVGATNVARLCGKKWGALTLICDVLKGAIPVLISLHLSNSPIVHSATALAAISGHLCSCFLHFKGGKAVATTVGVFLVLTFWPLVISAIICLLVIWRTNYVSAGSLVLVTALPITIVIFGYLHLLPLALIIMAIVFYTHRENIQRLRKGEEKSWIKKPNS